MNPITGLIAALIGITGVYLAAWGRAFMAAKRAIGSSRSPADDTRLPTALHLAIGFVTNFFDTIGIGSYAPTTAIYKLKKVVDDRLIPGTMTIGHTLGTTVQTVLFTAAVPVDVTTLFSMIGAAILGAWLGAGVVAKWPKRKIQVGMGIALLVAGTLMFFSNGGPFDQMTGIKVLPGGGDAIGVTGIKLAIAVGVNFVLGALMTLGIGLYAPCMITIYLLGMTPRAAFPIMMGSCAFLMPVAAIRFIKEKSYSNRPALGLTMAGFVGVLIAFRWFMSLPIEYVKWVVVAVVLYTSISMLRSAFAGSATSARETVEVEA
jgi:uncharacterized membrane protein YfcA